MNNNVLYNITVGTRYAGYVSILLILFTIFLMVWYWRRRFFFPLMRREKYFLFSVAIGFIGICINFIAKAFWLGYPCGITLFWFTAATLGVCQIYSSRTWLLLFRYKLQIVIHKINNLWKHQNSFNTERTKSLLNSFYVRKRHWATHRTAIVVNIVMLIIMQTYLLFHAALSTNIFSQPNQCNIYFSDGSDMIYQINSFFILAHVPFTIVISFLLWNFDTDGFRIKDELRFFGIFLIFIVPIYEFSDYMPYDISIGQWLTLLGMCSFLGSAFLFPLILSYRSDQSQRKELKDAIKKSGDSWMLGKAVWTDSGDSIITMSWEESVKLATTNPHQISYRRFVGLLQTDAGYDAISNHLEKFFCSELVLFFREVEEYKHDPTVAHMYDIHSKYIGGNAPLEINLQSATLKNIEIALIEFQKKYEGKCGIQNNLHGIPDIFDHAIDTVITLIKSNMSHKFRFPPEAWQNAILAPPRNIAMQNPVLSSTSKKRRNYTLWHNRYKNKFSNYTLMTESDSEIKI